MPPLKITRLMPPSLDTAHKEPPQQPTGVSLGRDSISRESQVRRPTKSPLRCFCTHLDKMARNRQAFAMQASGSF